MANDLSTLEPVKLDPGKASWLECQYSGRVKGMDKTTHGFGIPSLMPATIIFVHGVNSEGEWYEDAAEQFAEGLNRRLGRDDLERLRPDSLRFHRLLHEVDNKRVHSPIIPFYWGYRPPDSEIRALVKDPEKLKRGDTRHRETLVDAYGNPLRNDGSWGGGPFQNGSGSLAACWLPEGFRVHILANTLNIDLNALNPVLGRKLTDCPDRMYYVHAARRLAFLVKEIRDNHEREPVNIVSHSQGTMIALLSLFYMKELGIRGPDTVMLNSSPYRFDNLLTDWLSAAEGLADLQSQEARRNTFRNAARYLQAARDAHAQAARMPDVDCRHTHTPRHPYDEKVVAQVPDCDGEHEWKKDIGNGEVDHDGRKWWELKRHYRDDARGTLYVNFNPQDRVIGVSAVAGIGWRGVPTSLLDEGKSLLRANVKQRLFVRGSDPVENPQHNPAVGQRSNYRQPYFYQQLRYEPVHTGSGGVLVTSDGRAVQTEENNWHYIDGSNPNRAWKIPSEKILSLIPVLGSVGLQYGNFHEDGGKSEYVYINAPEVPRPAVLGPNFDGDTQPYDGQPMAATKERDEIVADTEQQEAFEEDVTYQMPLLIKDKATGEERYETWEEVSDRREKAVGRTLVPPTNHAALLRYYDKLTRTSTVAQVLAYDLCVGRGYAWHDEAFWNYLLALADWRCSDPYWVNGDLSHERKHCKKPPEGVDMEMVSVPPPTPPRPDPAMR